MRRLLAVLFVAVMFLAVPVATSAQAEGIYRIANGRIAVVCPLTIGGTFEAITTNVSGEIAIGETMSGRLGGAVSVELRTLETGIGLRDRHMRDYLEVDKGRDFAVARFEALQISGLQGQSSFSGTMILHGQRRQVNGTAVLSQREGGRLRVLAQFRLRVSDFEIPSPTYLGVGIRDELQVKVTLTALPVTARLVGSHGGQ